MTAADNQAYRGRMISSIAATLIALACGTNYVYSAWAPQFAAQLRLSATQTELIGLAGNLGMYSMGIPVGMFIDSKGPRPAVIIGAILLFVGYFPLHTAYDNGSGSVAWMCFVSFLSGLGGCTAFAASIKTSALNWPHHRGTATAFPLAAFGLSAFFFSLISSICFPGSAGKFLLLLAIGTSGLTFFGFFFLRVLPPAPVYHAVPPETGLTDSQQLHRTVSVESKMRRDGRSFAQAGMSSAGASTSHEPLISEDGDAHVKPGRAQDVSRDPQGELSETSSLMSRSSLSSLPGELPVQESVDMDRSHRIDIRGLKLLTNIEFWQMWIIMGILSGIGIMTINNIGNDATALWKHYDDSIDDKTLVLHQQLHVSILSIGSFAGRLLSGVGSDFLVKTLHASRVWCLVIASAVFSVAQVCALNIINPNFLGFVSGFSGLGYGFLFGVYPSIVAESFGIHGLSQNWGAMTLSPVVSSNLFNLFYGQVFDAHSVIEEDGSRTCEDGIDCYWNAYLVTLGACALGMAMTLWTIWYQKRARLAEKIYGTD